MSQVEFWLRAVTVLVGVGFLLLLPRAMFWPQARRPYALFLFAAVSILTVSALLGIVYAQSNGLPLRWYGTPMRLVALLFGWAYLIGAWRHWKAQTAQAAA